jgi:hypothetical protein
MIKPLLLVLVFMVLLGIKPQTATLEIDNRTNEVVTVWDIRGKLAWLRPYETVCVRMNHTHLKQQLRWRFFTHTQTYSTLPFTPNHSYGWQWSISDNVSETQISIAPTGKMCVPDYEYPHEND